MNELSKLLVELRANQSLREASKKIGISHTYLDTLEKGIDNRSGSEVKPTPETLKLISLAYDYNYIDLLIVAGYLDNASSTHEHNINVNFGQKLRVLRESKEMTLNQLAVKSGISAAQLSRLENAKRSVPKPETIAKIAKGLNESYQDLMRIAGYIMSDSLTEKEQNVLNIINNNEGLMDIILYLHENKRISHLIKLFEYE